MEIGNKDKVRTLVIFSIAAIMCLIALTIIPITGADCPVDCPSGMISYWKLDETAAGPVVDCYNGNDGTNNGAFIGAPGKVETAYDFDGTNDYVTIPHDSSLNFGTGDFSYELWFKQDVQGGTVNDYRQLICKRITGSGNKPNLECQILNDNLEASLGDYTGYATLEYPNIQLNTWYFVCVVRESGIGKLYINTNMEDSELASYDLSFSRNIYIGNDDYKPEYWDGLIDEVAFYDRALATDEISYHYYAGLAGYGYCDIPTEVWVDDNWVGSSLYQEVETGKFYGYNAFSTIQDGINAVCVGGIVHVYAGTYPENLASWKNMEITKSLSLIGAGSGSSVVQLDKQNGVEIRGTSLTVLIEGITFTKKPVNTYAASFNLKIAETPSTFTSLVLRDVEVAYANGPNVNLGTNGVFNQVIIENCNFHHAGTWGLYSQGQLPNGMTVTNSHFDYNGLYDPGHGIGFDLTSYSGSPSVTVTGGTFNYNTAKGINLLRTSSSTFNNIQVNNNGQEGVCLWEWYGTSQNLIFNNPTLNSNGLDGFLIGAEGGCIVNGVTINGGTLQNNGRGGLFIYNMGGTIQNIVITNSNIVGNTQYGVFTNTAPAVLAKCNWWGAANGPGIIASGSGDHVTTNVIYCPWLDAAYPLGTCMGGIVCRNVQTGLYYCSIQAAIDDPLTNDGPIDFDTIEVFALTRVEQVEIYKKITLCGQGIGSTIIQSPDILTKSFTTSAINKPIIYVHDVDGVIIRDLTVDGAGKGNANYRFVGIGIYHAGATVKDIEVKNIRDTPFSGAQHGVAIYGYSDLTGIPHNIVVQSCNIHDYQKNGITLAGSDLTVTVTGCTVTGVGPTTVTAQNGIQVSSGAKGSVIGNTVSGCSYTGPSWAASGILPQQSGGILQIKNNILMQNQVNIYVVTCSANIDGNQITATAAGTGHISDYFYGMILDPGDPPIIPDVSPIDEARDFNLGSFATYTMICTNNVLQSDNSEYGVGIGVYAGYYGDVIDFSAMYNNVLNWYMGFELYEDAPNLLLGEINYNNIVGNTYGIYNWMTRTYNCECNWYGDILGPTHPSNIYGVGDSVSDYVDYIPWLNLPFEDPNTVCEMGVCQDIVYVDDDYKPSTPGYFIYAFPTIQMALDRLDEDGTAIIYDGEYDEDLIIDDFPCDNTGITIIGEYGCFPTDQAAVIQGHAIISVDDVTIKYLEFKPTTDAAITVADGVTGTTFEFNKFRRDCITDAIGVQALDNAIVDAEANWWGAQDGPNGGMMDDGKTPNGNGVILIGEVLVEPWIGIHAEISEPIGTIEVSLGTPVTFDATGSFAYSFGDCCELTELPMQYLWDFGDGSQSANMIATHIFDQVGTYQVTLMVDSEGIPGLYANFMYDWAYVTVHVVTEDTTLTANADGGNLGGYETIVYEPLQLFGDAYGGKGEYIWHWNFGDQTADSNMQNPIHTYTKPGIYTATLTVTSDGETATDTAQVRVYDIDELFVTINDANAIAGIETMFAANIKGGTSPYTISWDFGDGSTSQETYPTHIYASPGEYTITVIVTDNKQKTATDTATINVEEENIIEEAEIKEVKAGLGVTAVIDAGENNCHWEITVKGKVFLGGENSGTIDANTQETVKLGFSLAFGEVNIVVKAAGIQKEYTAFALGPLYFNLQEV